MATNITSLSQLKALYGEPKAASVKKQSTHLTSAYRQWIEQSTFFVISSVGTDGVNCTPRGDEPGKAFKITDEKTIVIPDRRGNNRIDTLSNLVVDPRIALLFFIPGIHQLVRVIGKARISTEPSLLDQFVLDGKRPVCCICVSIDAVLFQNARAMVRSKLWDAAAIKSLDEVPTPGEMLHSVDESFDPDTYESG